MFNDTNKKPVKYRTIRLREEVAVLLDEWKDVFEDGSMSEIMWRIMSLAQRELKRVNEKKKKAREGFVKKGKINGAPVPISAETMIKS